MQTNKKAITLIAIFIFYVLNIANLYGSEYEKWLQEQNKDIQKAKSEFANYKQNADDGFANMLKSDKANWQRFRASYNPSPMKPKPISLLTAPKTKTPPTPPPSKVGNKIHIPSNKAPQPQPPKPKPLKTNNNQNTLYIDFFGNKIKIAYNKSLKIKNHQINKQSIGDFYSSLNEQKLNTLMDCIIYNKRKFRLNDWGLYLLVDKIAKELKLDTNNQALFGWYILMSLGYDVKISYTNSGDAFLLANIKQKLYQVSFYKINSRVYYILSNNGYFKQIPSITTYTMPSDKHLRALDINNYFIIATNKKYNSQREISFEYENKKYKFNVKYNKALAKYYDSFPQAQYSVYLNTQMQTITYNSFARALKPILQGKSELWGVNFLLALTQHSFKYKTDNAQFGREKPLFSVGSLYYPYNDCEDRVILFSRLVKDLLGLKVVAIKYSNHLSSAVLLSNVEQLKGQYVVHKNKKYIIADPTYINASAGMIMPMHKNAQYSLIE